MRKINLKYKNADFQYESKAYTSGAHQTLVKQHYSDITLKHENSQ